MSFKVFGKLLLKGHIYEEAEGTYFRMQTTLTFTGDWQNFIYYKKEEQLNQNELNQLLSMDDLLLEESVKLSLKIQSYLKGLNRIPWLFSVLLGVGSLKLSFNLFPEEYQALISGSSVGIDNWKALIGPTFSVLLVYFRSKALNYLLLMLNWIYGKIRWILGT